MAFKFNVGDKVKIKHMKLHCKILQQTKDGADPEYEVETDADEGISKSAVHVCCESQLEK